MTRVVRITVGTGSPEGANSAYLLPDHGLLVDPGPPGDDAWQALRAGFRGAAVPLDDVDHVVVTHWHADHAGLAPRLATESEATVHMHARDAPFVADYEQSRADRLDRDAAALRRWGVPESAAEAVIRGDSPSPMPPAFAVDGHEDGDEVAGGRLVHTPGHTAGHVAVAIDEHLFVGDAVLSTYTPNVGGSDTRLANPLDDYLTTLSRLDRLAERFDFHPGHGETVDLPGRLEQIRAHHARRTERVSDYLTTRGQATPWEIAGDLFGDLTGIHVKFGAGEAAAHLAFLEERGHVTQVGDDTAVYEPHRRYDAVRDGSARTTEEGN